MIRPYDRLMKDAECNSYALAEKIYQLGRADAFDEFVAFANTMPTVEDDDGEIRPMWLEEMAEQLKEQKDDRPEV